MTRLGDMLLEQYEQRARERAERLRGMLLDEKAAELEAAAPVPVPDRQGPQG
ncbi:MAG: hypothetical protein KDK11_11615 [Maritimibacter sp.]|nr:hypothetical protein [Maritimibacter sp.]